MKKPGPAALAFLAGVPFAMVLSNSLIVPILPVMQEGLEISASQVGLVVTAFSITAGLAIPVAGFLSDRLGRKVIMVPALVVFGIGGLLAGLAPLLGSATFGLILGARVIQGIGGGGTYQLAQALTGDLFQPKQRSQVLGLLESANGLGKVASPIVGSALGMIAWAAPFYLYPLVAIPVALGVWFLVPEPPRKEAPPPFKKYMKTVVDIFKQRAASLLSTFLVAFTVLFMLFGVLAYWSDILEDDFEIEGIQKGLIIAVPVLVMAITSYVNGRFLKNNKPACKLVMVIGAGLLGISLAITGFTESLGFLMATISLQGLGSGLCLPAINNLVTGSADTLQRGIITGFYGTVRFFGAALGPPAFGLIQENPTTFFVIGGVVTVGVAALAYFFVTPNQNQGGPQGKEIRLVQPTPPKKAPMKPGPLKREPV